MTSSVFDLIQLIASNVWLYGGTFLIVLSILVFVHEWGHYAVARLCGIRVETFSIGFGKEIFGITDSHGTRWKFSLFPLGGYVKMFGDTDPASAGADDKVKDGEEIRPMTENERKEAFFSKPVWKRAAVVFAGPGINFIFAIVLLAGLYMFHGRPVTPPLASGIFMDSPAARAGFAPHDEILSINGRAISSFEEIQREVAVALDTELLFELRRQNGDVETVRVTPEKLEMEDHFGFSHSQGRIGILGPGNGLSLSGISAVDGRPYDEPEDIRSALLSRMGTQFEVTLGEGAQAEPLLVQPLADRNEKIADPDSPMFNKVVLALRTGDDVVHYPPVAAVFESFKETGSIIGNTLEALGQMITGVRSPTELGGIIRIGAIAGDMAQLGFIAMITFTALLSINLGLINLFPIPMLDGGHLAFYAVEAARGSPVPENVQEYAFRFGLVILIGIMLFANLNDIVQLLS